MCGVWGVASTNVEKYLGYADKVQSCLKHRGPDSEGIWVSNTKDILLGHVRLSIQDVTTHGAQPMISSNGRFILSYNGEIYNKKELSALISGRELKGHSDTELLLENIAEYGLQKTLPRLIGMFAFALVDLETRKVYLVRDRIGIKPLYYYVENNRLIFSSELKPFRVLPEIDLSINVDSVHLYSRHNYIPEPYSIYKHIHKLKPGYCLTYDLDTLTVQSNEYFWAAQNYIDKADKFTSIDEATSFYESLIEDAVNIRLVSDVPLGCFLSGGYDSTIVAAMMQKVSGSKVKTFSIGFNEESYNEAPFAKEVAGVLGTDHHELYVTEQEALDVVSDLPFIYDEPFADSSQIPTYLVSKMARSNVTVCLSGDGGDEVFAGYNRYIWLHSVNNKLSMLPQISRSLMKNIILSRNKDTWDKLFRYLQRLIPKRYQVNLPGDKLYKLAYFLNKDSVLDRYHSIVSIMQDPKEICLGESEADVILNKASLLHGLSDMTAMQFVDLLTYLPGDILTKVDRASMAVSLEARVPLLDHRLVENMSRLPDNYKVNSGSGKLVLKNIVHKYVPKQIMDRPKMGFGIPLGNWLKKGLLDYAENYLSEDSLRKTGVYDIDAVRKIWSQHKSGTRNCEYILWGILMMQAWSLQ